MPSGQQTYAVGLVHGHRLTDPSPDDTVLAGDYSCLDASMPPPHAARVGPSSVALAAAAVAALLLWLVACSHDRTMAPSASSSIAKPLIREFSVGANPFNALSTVVTFRASEADSARVVYTTASDTTAATPFTALTGDSGRVVTLGLLPNTSYSNRLELVGAGGTTTETFRFSTGSLPAYLRTASLNITGAFGRGYTVVSPILYAGDSVLIVAFDTRGRVRWYRTFPPGQGSAESKQQANGHFTIALGGSTGSDTIPETYAEFLPSGAIVATYTAPPGEHTDPHELIMTGPVSAPILHLFGGTARPFDFSALGGPSNAVGIGHQVIRETPTGDEQFLWDSWAHFTIADWVEPTGVNPPNDFDHPNSLAFDLDSNYVVSFRHLGAIVKLDAQTGAKIWQVGGRLGQFTILKDPLGLFSGQHCVQVLDNGHLLMYDNGLRHNPPHTRAVEYALDLDRKTATMVWEYEPNPAIFTPIVGSVQRLGSGNTLVGFGLVGQMHEVDAQSRVIGNATFSVGTHSSFYRAARMVSLYRYVKP